MLTAVAAFAVMDVTLKQLAHTYPPMQVGFMRGLASIPFFLTGVAVSNQWSSLRPVQWTGHLARGGIAILMLWLFIYAVRRLPLSTAYGIFLCAPLLITALSALVLHERVGYHRWIAIACGLAGVVLILNPDRGDMITLAGLAALMASLCYAVTALMIRQLSRTDSTLSIALSFMVIVALGTGIAAIPNWMPVQDAHWRWILAMGASGAVGQYLIIYAFRSAPPSAVAPLEYTALLWGIGFDWFLWSTVPSARMLSGAGIVVASGLYLLYRERRSVQVSIH